MRMKVRSGTAPAIDSLMEQFLTYLLQHPERFARSEVPCSVAALWELALEGHSFQLDVDHMQDISRLPPTIRPFGGSYVN